MTFLCSQGTLISLDVIKQASYDLTSRCNHLFLMRHGSKLVHNHSLLFQKHLSTSLWNVLYLTSRCNHLFLMRHGSKLVHNHSLLFQKHLSTSLWNVLCCLLRFGSLTHLIKILYSTLEPSFAMAFAFGFCFLLTWTCLTL